MCHHVILGFNRSSEAVTLVSRILQILACRSALKANSLLLQIEYKSRLEGIEAIALDVLKEKLQEGLKPAAGQSSRHRKKTE